MCEEENGNGIEADGPHGFKLRARGHLVYVTIIIIMCTGALAYLVWDHAREQGESVKAMTANQKAILDAQQETTYVLTLTQEQRERLKLRMPDSLRSKVRE